ASVGEVSDLVGEIAAASQEQASGISEINDALSQVDSVTQQNTAKAEEMAAASRELSSNSATLTQLLSRFRLAEAPAPARPTLTPEMMSALQLFMTQRGLHTASRGASPREQASTNGLGYNPPLNDPDFGDF
ncbi:MAG TPA: chemotaxis protein, partial [Deltaproteobacteria bacterium]|nr:chemotaxis protein [Deltaproteobacteria bacterium]